MSARRLAHAALAGCALAGTALAAVPTTSASAVSGELDPTFGTGGTVQVEAGPAEFIAGDVAALPDGGVVVVGSKGGNTDGTGLLQRFTSDGTPDAAFGRRVLDVPAPGRDLAVAVAVQPDGGLVVVGSTTVGEDAVVWRRLPSGEPDPSFGGGDGVVVLPAPGAQAFDDVAVAPDGRVVAVGYDHRPPAAALGTVHRFTPTGEPDTSFGGGDGWVVTLGTASFEVLHDVAITPGGSLVVAGSTSAGGGQGTVQRLTPAGDPDATFGPGGVRLLPHSAGGASAEAVAVQADGKVLVTGRIGTSADVTVRRLTAGGEPDLTFDGDGQAQLAGLPGKGTALDLQPDGRIVVAAGAHPADGQDAVLVRLTPSGQVDPGFGGASGTRFALAGYQSVSDVEVAPDGAVVASGHTDASAPDALVLRVDADGTPDPDFGTAGALTLPGATMIAYDAAVQADGKIVVAGDDAATSPRPVVHRLLNDLRRPSGLGPVPTCAGRPATLVGTPGADRLRGTAGADVVVALGGNDVVRGLRGDDVVCAGAGSDRVTGGAGRDRLHGERGRDRLVGGPGRDRLLGGPQRDTAVQ